MVKGRYPELPVGGRLKFFIDQWKLITDDKWVLSTIANGYKLEFQNLPPFSGIRETHVNANNQAILNSEVESLLQKAAIEPVPFAQRQQGFYSTFFLVPKKSGELRAVINLRPLNQYLKTQHFKMDTLKTVLNLVKKGDWAISIDLKDAYFHIMVHIKHRKYLRFCIQGKAYQFRALAFGPKTSPRVFTKIVAVAAAHLRMQSIRLAVYLDDWLALNAKRRFLLKNREIILSLFSRLGFLVNKEKSNLIPTQDIVYIGGRFCLDKGIVMPTPERIIKLRNAVLALLGKEVTARQYLQTLGLMASCLEIIPNARLQMRPIQLHLLHWWKPVSRDLELLIPKITAFEGASELVVTGSQHSQGQIFVSNPSQQNNCHGCFHSNVGRKSGSSDHTGFLVRKTERTTHKLSGVGGSNLDYKKLPSSVEKSMCSGSIRQHNSDSVYLPSGRDSVASTVLQNLGTLAVGYQEQYHTESSSHSGKIEHPTRPVEQGSNKAHRMDLEQCSFKSNLSYLGETFDRSLCIISQQEDGHLLHLGPSSPSLRCRCFLSDMESNVCVWVPANLPDSQSFGTHEARTMSGHSDSAAMAKKTLVSGSTTIVHCKSNQVTRDSQSLESTKHNNISSGSQSVQSECMAAINRHLSASGFSQEVRNLLSASWRAGTQKDYSGKFKQFSSWCRGKQIDTYSASLTDCAEFLSSLFHKGLQYRTIAGYRSMLSSVLPPVNNIPVGQHPHIVRLIKGIFNSRPPTTKLLPEWELPLVLGLLKRPPFEPLSLAPLKYLTWKSLFLVAITTFRRASDIQALKLGSGNVSVQKRGITFI